jgi:hypothetical protein
MVEKDLGQSPPGQTPAENPLEFNQKTQIKIKRFANAKFTFDICGPYF